MSKFIETIKTSLATQQQNLFGQGPPSYSLLPNEETDVKSNKFNDLENQSSQIRPEFRDSIEETLEQIHQGSDSDEFVGSSRNTSNHLNQSRITSKINSDSKRRLSYPSFIIIVLFTYLTLTLIGLSTPEPITLHLLATIIFLSIGLLLFATRILQHFSPETFENESVIPSMRLHYQFISFEFLMILVSTTFLLERIANTNVVVLTIFSLVAIGGMAGLSEIFVRSLML
jgi:hypothetical protein